MKKDFVHFLKKRNAYGKYRKAFFEQRMSYSSYPFNLLNDSLVEQINHSFTWSKTKEGHDFWWGLDAKWRKFCDEKNIKWLKVEEEMWL